MTRIDAPIGQRFGKLVVLREVDRRVDRGGQKRRAVVARCECGAEGEFLLFNILHGKSNSCGCGRSNPRHGMRRTPTWASWIAMIQRCTDKGSSNYPRYGGAGVSVCERWRAFENFLSDMGERPVGTSIDRIDNSRGYEPGNCRWASAKEQARNQRTNRILTYDGIAMPLAAWAERMRLNPGTLRTRLRDGWDVSRAITTPTKR